MAEKLTRRQFIRDSTVAAAALAAGVGAGKSALASKRTKVDTSKILNYNPDMEYRRCGRTGLIVSAVCLGGHWKRLVKIIGGAEPEGWMTSDINRRDFQKNRHAVVTRCIERGINYVDACCREEILAYSK
ncbi:MAG: twin-arginine translocation signal domain-containing protein, partial [Planctomycetota bacterium]